MRQKLFSRGGGGEGEERESVNPLYNFVKKKKRTDGSVAVEEDGYSADGDGDGSDRYYSYATDSDTGPEVLNGKNRPSPTELNLSLIHI